MATTEGVNPSLSSASSSSAAVEGRETIGGGGPADAFSGTSGGGIGSGGGEQIQRRPREQLLELEQIVDSLELNLEEGIKTREKLGRDRAGLLQQLAALTSDLRSLQEGNKRDLERKRMEARVKVARQRKVSLEKEEKYLKLERSLESRQVAVKKTTLKCWSPKRIGNRRT